MDDILLRIAMFAHLDRLVAASPDGSLRSADINRFTFEGRPMRLTVQTGIWKPAGLEAALTIRTTYTAPEDKRPYDDEVGPDGLIRYKYRGIDPDHSDNRALRAAMMAQVPLAYFLGIGRGIYVAHYPVWLADEDRSRHEFAVQLYEAQRAVDLEGLDALQRDYVIRLARSRLHQPAFRARVLRAYAETCAMCRLRHPQLLDAAHILPDSHSEG